MLYKTSIYDVDYVIDTDDFIRELLDDRSEDMLAKAGIPVVPLFGWLRSNNGRFVWSIKDCIVVGSNMYDIHFWYKDYYYHYNSSEAELLINNTKVEIAGSYFTLDGVYLDNSHLCFTVGDGFYYATFIIKDFGCLELNYEYGGSNRYDDIGVKMSESVFRSKILLGGTN